MHVRQLAFTAILCFAAGLIIASYASFRDFLPGLLSGAFVTLQITIGGCLLAMAVAVVAAMGKMYGPRPVKWLAVAYIEVFRGTSALVQLFWMFFVLPHFGVMIAPMTAAIVALGLNIGAYGAEVVRGAVTAVPRGQWEATVALNMTRIQALKRIILPQALISMIPPWGNLFIELLKMTALVSLITVSDLTFQAQQINQITFRTVEIFSVVMVMYLAISVIITLGMRSLEQYASKGLARGRG